MSDQTDNQSTSVLGKRKGRVDEPAASPVPSKRHQATPLDLKCPVELNVNLSEKDVTIAYEITASMWTYMQKIPFFKGLYHQLKTEGSADVDGFEDPKVHPDMERAWDVIILFLEKPKLHKNFIHYLFDVRHLVDMLGLHPWLNLYEHTRERLKSFTLVDLTTRKALRQLVKQFQLWKKNQWVKNLFQLPNPDLFKQSYLNWASHVEEIGGAEMLYQWSLPVRQSCITTYQMPELRDIWLDSFSCQRLGKKRLQWPADVVWAGGSLAAARNEIHPNKMAEDADIDLWAFSLEGMRTVLASMEQGFDNAYFVVRKSIIDIVSPGVKIQIIFAGPNKTPAQVVEEFDMDFLRQYYDHKGQLHSFPECDLAYTNQTVSLMQKNLKPLRYLKALEKGFQLPPGTETKLDNFAQQQRWRVTRTRNQDPEERVVAFLRSMYHSKVHIVCTADEAMEAFGKVPFGDGWNTYQRHAVPLEQLEARMNEVQFLDAECFKRARSVGGDNMQCVRFKHPVALTLDHVMAMSLLNTNMSSMGERIEMGMTIGVQIKDQRLMDLMESLEDRVGQQARHHSSEPETRYANQNYISLLKYTNKTNSLAAGMPPLMNLKMRSKYTHVQDRRHDKGVTVHESQACMVSLRAEIFGIYSNKDRMWGLMSTICSLTLHDNIDTPACYRAGLMYQTSF